jgi:hypothetical protein
MTKKHRQSKKAKKSSKRTEVAAKPEDEIDTDNMSAPTEIPQATPATSDVEIAVEPQQAEAVAAPAAPAAPATPATPSNPATRSEAAKANIKEGLRLHQIAGRPTRQQLTQVFGQKGYLLTWPKRTEKFGITPETFQAALAKGVQATPLAPVTEQSKKS